MITQKRIITAIGALAGMSVGSAIALGYNDNENWVIPALLSVTLMLILAFFVVRGVSDAKADTDRIRENH